MSITATKFFSIDPACLTPDVEDRFFTDLKTYNNTFKRTASNRFRDIDDCCVRHFEGAGAGLDEVLDIGVSSGSTTLDLGDRLNAAGQRVNIVGTDLSLTGYLMQVMPGLRVLIDENGHPLQYEVLGKAIRAWGRRADYVTGMVLVRGVLHFLCQDRVHRRLHEHDGSLRPLQLVSPRLRNRADIRIEKNDIFTRTSHFVERFDFIRAANILNRGYFDETTLRRGFANVVSYLSGPGAWLLVARTNGAANAATLFRVSPDGKRLLVVDRIGGGSEVERLALWAPLPFRRMEA
jgi:hypothetical protein